MYILLLLINILKVSKRVIKVQIYEHKSTYFNKTKNNYKIWNNFKTFNKLANFKIWVK